MELNPQNEKPLSFKLILHISYLFPLICFFILRRKQFKPFIILMLFYAVSFFLLLSYYRTLTKWVDQGFYSTFYTFLEYLLFTSFILLNILSSRLRKLVVTLSIGFVIFQVVYLLNTSIKNLDTIAIGVETILLFSYVICFFYEQFRKQTSLSIYNHYCFWISVGILIYLGGSFFFYIMANHLTDSEINRYWEFTYIGEIIKNILFSLSVYLFARNKAENGMNKRILPNLDMV